MCCEKNGVKWAQDNCHFREDGGQEASLRSDQGADEKGPIREENSRQRAASAEAP